MTNVVKKKIYFIMCVAFGTLTVLMMLLFLVFFIGASPDLPARSVTLYEDDANYRTIECKITKQVKADDGDLLLAVTHGESNLGDGFILYEDNARIAIDNGLLDVIGGNTAFTVTVNPEYLKNGWLYPVASISNGDKTFLEYAQGKQNIVESRKYSRKLAVTCTSVSGALLGACAIGLVVSICLYFKKESTVVTILPADTTPTGRR